MQRATVVQLHYVVDHPIVGEQLIYKKLPICNTFRDKRHLLILAGISLSYAKSYRCAISLCGRSPKR